MSVGLNGFRRKGLSQSSVQAESAGLGSGIQEEEMADLEKMVVMTDGEREARRQAVLNELGKEPPCPFCGRPRVARSSYIRCQRCGINWLDEEMGLRDYLNRNPSACRWEAAHMGTGTKLTAAPLGEGANG
jgi:hypothetical protein